MPGAERILDFSLGQAHLALRYEQLLVRRDGHPDLTLPLDETAVVILASRQLTCTLPVLDAMMRHGAAVVICDEAMLPSGLLLPLAAHFAQTPRMIAQVSAKRPLQKQLWRQIVRAKVRAQGTLLALTRDDDAGLFTLADRVRSGDPDNIEAQAAQRYWPLLFNDPDFLRRRDAPNQNRLLNYGYAVLRAAVARSICAAGLHPSLGVHHHGRTNPFCLADDLMEPYRPLIDGEALAITNEWGGDIALDGRIKQRLVGALHERLAHEDEQRTAIDCISRSAVSLSRCFGGEEKRLFFPDGLVRP